MASSSAAAIEALLFYEQPVVEQQTSHACTGTKSVRYLEFGCDSPELAVHQYQELLSLFSTIEVVPLVQTQSYEVALEFLERSLDRIVDQDDLRAYEMYDFLPYHLGEDPTAIECQVDATSGSNLDELDGDTPEQLQSVCTRLKDILRSKLHPTRVAWALPLVRLLYYEALQQIQGMHFVPHGTKSTIGFGRENQTIKTKRLLDYCSEETRVEFLRRLDEQSGGATKVVIPSVAGAVLRCCDDWRSLLGRVQSLRDSPHIQYLRAVISETLDGSRLVDGQQELSKISEEIHRVLAIEEDARLITVSSPFFDVDDFLPDHGGIEQRLRVFIHQLFG